ncbi:MAG: DctP family TRAP transporter solute-binding subunit [Candidatus Accumulibacter sp.]|jgi:tripartite ATP-independent transporter DctP family solute receptor|nr:DctP family TRAP transporter solute-binding subunit [Accumulibacter sp.]
MMKKMFKLLSCAVALTALTAGFATAAVTIKFAHNGNTIPEDPQNVAVTAFKKMVEERSKGEIQVQIYPAAQLGDARTITEGVQMGTIEMGDVENGPMGRFVREAMVWDLPFIFRDIEHAHKVLDGPIGKAFQEKFLARNIRHLAYNDGGFRYFTNSKRPIRTLKDLEGLKIRVMESEVMLATMKAFGAAALPMAFGELYTALQQGTVDGQENPMNLIFSQRFYEVQKYLSMSQHFYYPRQYLISETFYQSLKPEHRKIVADAAKEACDIQRAALVKYEDEMKKVLAGKGMQIVEDFDKPPFIKVSQEKVYPMFYAKIFGTEAEGKKVIQQIIDTK